MTHRWCAHDCPFHDRGERFSCHAHNASSMPRCVDLPYRWDRVCDVLRMRTIVFVGDSLSRQTFDTFLCHIWASVGNVASWRHTHDVHTRCVSIPGCGKVCLLDAGVPPSATTPNVSAAIVRARTVSSRAPLIVVANDGAWYTHGEVGWPTAIRAGIARARTMVRTWRDIRAPADCLVWRETSPQHFQTHSGVFPGQSHLRSKFLPPAYVPQPCVPIATKSESPWSRVNEYIEHSGIPIVRVWEDSRRRFDAHLDSKTPYVITRHDCTHWCTPGVVDVWITRIVHVLSVACAPNVPHLRGR